MAQESVNIASINTRSEKMPNSTVTDSADDSSARNVYIMCLNNLHTINLATEYQQTIKEEMKKFSKLERAVSQKKSYQAERLATLIESKTGRSSAGSPWFEESVQSLIKQLTHQAHSHISRTDVLAKQGGQIQAFLDSHQEVMSILHDNDSESSSNGGQNSSTCIPRPRSPRKSITASDRRQEGQSGVNDNKWFISPPPLTPPRFRNQDGPMGDFRKAYVKYESIRKSRIMLDNRLGYLQMQHKSVVGQLEEATSSMAGIPDVPTGKMLPWSTQSKLEDLRSRQEFLKKQKEQTEAEMKDVRKEMREFDNHQSHDMDQILFVFEATKNRYDNFLKQSLSVLKAAIVAESPTGDSERYDLKNNFDSCLGKPNSWETFEDRAKSASGKETASGVPGSPSPTNKTRDRGATHISQSRDLVSQANRSSPVDPLLNDDNVTVYEKKHRFQNDVHPVTGYWDDTTNDTLHCGEDSSISDLEGHGPTNGFDGTCTNPSTSVDTSKWLFGNASAGLGAFNGISKHMKEEGVTRRFGLPLSNQTEDKHQVSVTASNNKTNNRNLDRSNSDLRANEQLDEKREEKEQSNVVILHSSPAGKCVDGLSQSDKGKEEEKVLVQRQAEPVVKNKNDEDKKIKNYISKYLRSLRDADGNLIGKGDGSLMQQGIWRGGPDGFMNDNTPITITVSKESTRKLRVCTVHPISPSSENLCQDGFSSARNQLQDSCHVQSKSSCRQESINLSAGDGEEQPDDREKIKYYLETRADSEIKNDRTDESRTKTDSEARISKENKLQGEIETLKNLKMKVTDDEEEDGKRPVENSLREARDEEIAQSDHRETVSAECRKERSDNRLVSNSKDDLEVEKIMSQLNNDQTRSYPGFEKYDPSERDGLDGKTPQSDSSNIFSDSTEGSDRIIPETSTNMPQQATHNKQCKQINCNEKTDSPGKTFPRSFPLQSMTTGAVITYSTCKTKTMLLNPPIEVEYNISNSDSESDSISLSASLTCSSSHNDTFTSRTMPILARTSACAKDAKKWKKKDKNVRFNERVQYTMFEDVEDRRNHYDIMESSGNLGDNDDDDDDDTFPID